MKHYKYVQFSIFFQQVAADEENVFDWSLAMHFDCTREVSLDSSAFH